MVELAARRHHVRAGFQQPAHVIDLEHPRHVDHAIGTDGQHVLDTPGGWNTDGIHPAEFAGVSPDLAGVVNMQARQHQSGVFDDSTQGFAADVAGGPLNHSMVRAHRTGCTLTGTPE
jgi:hypothetical protein